MQNMSVFLRKMYRNNHHKRSQSGDSKQKVSDRFPN
jgi:hypothetical protein